MSEQWRSLLRHMDTDLITCLSLDHVDVSRKSNRITVVLSADREILPEEQEQLCERFSSEFPNATVGVWITYSNMKDEAVQNRTFLLKMLKRHMERYYPGLAPMFDWGSEEWKLDDSLLTACAGDALACEYLSSHDAPQILERLMSRLFGMICKVQLIVTGNEERLKNEIEIQRERNIKVFTMEQPESRMPRKPSRDALHGHMFKANSMPMREIQENTGNCTVTGEVVEFNIQESKNGKSRIITFDLTDYTGTIPCKLFLSSRRGRTDESPKKLEEQASLLEKALKPGNWVSVRGTFKYDDYQHDMVLAVRDLIEAPIPVRLDNSVEKRVELHAHSTFSAADACISPSSLIKQAADWGHTAVAITDHAVVQSYPEAFDAAHKAGIKFLPGCEIYMTDDRSNIVQYGHGEPLSTPFVVADVETTGLNIYSDDIIEIGAVRIENGLETDSFSCLINPKRHVPERVTEITGITDAMLQGQPVMNEVIPKFAEFCRDAMIVAHNASFDVPMFRRAFTSNGIQFHYTTLDTLALSRALYPGFANHKLGNLCKKLGVTLENAHRAVNDARATGGILLKMLEEVKNKKGIRTLDELNDCFSSVESTKRETHAVLLATDQTGITNLYRLVSEAHLHHIYRERPRVPKGLIERWRDGLLIGSACENGELFQALLGGATESELEEIAKFYDYLEIQPVGNHQDLLLNGTFERPEQIQALNRRIVRLGEKLGIPVCATGDAHYRNKEDAILRDIVLSFKRKTPLEPQPLLYLRTTDEMLGEFAYLGSEKAHEVVITNPNRIASMVGDVRIFIPHPEGKETFQPYWPEAEADLRRLVQERAASLYGDPLPEIVNSRIEKELKAIIGYGFSTLYMIAVKLVSKSMSDGYIVGSRGSVGSSLVAFLSGITEVNALPPHYACPNCRHSEFDVPAEYRTGLDLPIRACPVCQTLMNRDGFNIPFEVFLGFKGDKVPDIDLNFSGEYQPIAHNYVKELFGKDNCFRAGTISAIQDKTAFGYVLHYEEINGIKYTKAEEKRLAAGITGVKRTTGQHPAGMVVLPKEYEIYQFTPINHPADKTDSDVITTHFDFSSMHDVLVKLDILGHDDPTMLRKLQDITGIAPQSVPLHDPEVFGRILSLFTGPEALGLKKEQLSVSETGTLGVPEFGTQFVRGMLKDTRPSTMEELIRISGLSHGTDVWLGNAKTLVQSGIPLRDCICTRDDIMNQLISYGVEPSMAFKTMESVRKGRGLTEDMEKAIQAVDAPDWFIDSCKKIKYMFPKAHAVAYVTMALRIAYFKIFYPTAYYCCYLQRNHESFDATRMVTNDVGTLLGMINEIKKVDKDDQTSKMEDANTLLEILVEMMLRNIQILPVDIYRSDAVEFKIVGENQILPPISTLPGVGKTAAEAFVTIRGEGAFVSVDDMLRRKVPKKIIDSLRQAGCLDDVPETSQVPITGLGL